MFSIRVVKTNITIMLRLFTRSLCFRENAEDSSGWLFGKQVSTSRNLETIHVKGTRGERPSYRISLQNFFRWVFWYYSQRSSWDFPRFLPAISSKKFPWNIFQDYSRDLQKIFSWDVSWKLSAISAGIALGFSPGDLPGIPPRVSTGVIPAISTRAPRRIS